MRLGEKQIVITGAGTGIGRAIARGLAHEGARIVCAGRTAETLAETVQLVTADGGQAVAVQTDIRDMSSVERLLAEAVGYFGDINTVVANAGGSISVKPFLELTGEDWVADRTTNLDGAFNTGIVFARHMVRHGGGSIVFVSSQLSEVARANMAAYCAAKGGVRMLARAMAIDLARHGIRVNCLAPGPTLVERMAKRHTPESMEREKRLIPVGRMGDPEDMVGAAIFLASDESAFVTGTTLFVDGGYVAW
jgi:NAD(P)-dependent dehydrogenase (short-subunit alcohol dehydrogenase family)